MANRPPEHCPRCGAALTPVDPPLAHHCEACDEFVFHNPTPAARVAVLDGDAVLLVRADTDEVRLWGTPGGMVEPGEDPDEAGARELAEETGLAVDPDDLVLFDARTFVKFEAVDKLSLSFAVDVADTAGNLVVGDEPRDARFWTVDELSRCEERLLTSWPAAHKDLAWWVREGRAALDAE